MVDNKEGVTVDSLMVHAQGLDSDRYKTRYLFNINLSDYVRSMACGTASYLDHKSGCVFPLNNPTLQFVYNAGYDRAYERYWKVCYDSENTHPYFSCNGSRKKRIRGCDPDMTIIMTSHG
ncbi:hypothetical protein ACFOY2_01755 [Nonomuraea purpurea]|uniref:Uncharacterized protein n=1 Tax=Nonomuraea purpurea TaxID=1849276 RepID=A0ABV8FYK0_9ACTN